MKILLSLLRNAPLAIAKYENREVAIFCLNRMAFISVSGYCLSFSAARLFTVGSALTHSAHFGNDCEIHFTSLIPYEKSSMQDFDEESFYNNPNVTWN